MKNSTWNLRLLLAFAALVLIAVPVAAGTLRNVQFRIKQGKHNDSNGVGFGLRCMQLKAKVDRRVRFQVRFPQSAAYLSYNPVNQWDWNKVMGITTTRIHKNSIRLGWRWNPTSNRMELGFYGYIKKQRISHKITEVALDTWADVEMTMKPEGLSVTVNGIKKEERKSLGLSRLFPTATWALRTAYFGGDEKAPHDIKIDLRNITVD